MPKGVYPRPSLEVRFWAKVIKGRENGCWIWTGYKTWDGYGQFRIRRERVYAHRVAYELLIGLIPDGLTLDHLCRNPSCVNPDHLEAVSERDNILRGKGVCAQYAQQTVCKRGHLFDLFNTRWEQGRRICRICRRQFRHAITERTKV